MSQRPINKEATPIYPAAGYAWYVVVILTLAYIVSFVDRQILALLVEPIKRDLDLSDTQVSLLLGLAFAVLYTLLGIPIGWLVDRTSRRWIIASGISLWCLMTVFCGLARSYMELFIARIGVGVGEATLGPGALSMISDYFPADRRGSALGFYSMGITVGAGLAMILGGQIIEWIDTAPPIVVPLIGELYAWQTVFLVVGLPGLLIALLMLTVREPKRIGLTDGDPHAQALAQKTTVYDALKFLIKSWRVYAGPILGMSGATVMGYGSLSWMPAMFIRTWDWTIAQIALVQGLVLLVIGPISVNLAGWLADASFQKGKNDAHMRVYLYFSVLMVISGIIFPLLPSGWMAAAGFGFNVMGAAGLTTLATAALMIVTPNQLRGQISAVYYLVMSLIGLTIGPTAVALITDYVFRDESAIRYSLSIVSAVAGVFTISIVFWSLGAYRERAASIMQDVHSDGATKP